VIASEDAVDWQDLVDTLGFYDQSHLIRDFKLATTLTPEFFVREKGKTIVPFREASIILSGPLVEQPDSYQRAMIEAEESEPRNLHRPQGCCRDPFY
jgi:AraC-like DNA-binding protein